MYNVVDGAYHWTWHRGWSRCICLGEDTTYPPTLNAYMFFFSTKIDMLPELTNDKTVAGMRNVPHKSSRGWVFGSHIDLSFVYEKRCEI
jgi:hypothetical protein